MVVINFISSKGVLKSVNATEGETIMDCAKNNDIYEIEAEVRVAHATCHVYIQDEWVDKLDAPTEMEEDMLDFAIDVKENSRLSCQIKIDKTLDGITIQTPEKQF